jgi:hypothetical protein
MIKVIPTDIYDGEGNMKAIEFNDLEGEFVIQAEWDERDAQTSENRVEFRKWAYRMVEQMGYAVTK